MNKLKCLNVPSSHQASRDFDHIEHNDDSLEPLKNEGEINQNYTCLYK